MKTKIIESFMFYMWNKWSEAECMEVFGEIMGKHIWSKWVYAYERCNGPWGATERIFSELSTTYRQMLVERACALYNGSERKEANI